MALVGELTEAVEHEVNDLLANGASLREKKVLNESSPPPMVLSEGIWPSG